VRVLLIYGHRPGLIGPTLLRPFLPRQTIDKPLDCSVRFRQSLAARTGDGQSPSSGRSSWAGGNPKP
jgi:hypothetical protein